MSLLLTPQARREHRAACQRHRASVEHQRVLLREWDEIAAREGRKQARLAAFPVRLYVAMVTDAQHVAMGSAELASRVGLRVVRNDA